MFELGRTYSRDYIASVVGGSAEAYLPQDQTGRIVAACFRFDLNPDVPDIVLPGSGPVIESSAREFCKGYDVPTFIKLNIGEWVHVGNFRVVRFSTDPVLIQAQQCKAEQTGRKRTGRERIRMVLYLGPVGRLFDLRTQEIRAPHA